MSKRLPKRLTPTRRLYVLTIEMSERQMWLLGIEHRTDAQQRELDIIDRRLEGLTRELYRRLDAYDELAKRAEQAAP